MKKIKIIYILIATLILTWFVFLALTPIISRDALIVHMAFPKVWMRENFFFYQDYNLSTVSMMNLDYIYMLLLKFFHWDQLPKIFHASLLIGSGVIMFTFLKKRFGLNTAFIFSVIFVLIPINQRLASEAYVDLGVLFFSTISIIYFIKWIDSDLNSGKYFFILAVSSGLSLGTKYSSVILLVVMTLMIGSIYAKNKKKDLKALNHMALYGIIILIVISPWLIRNYAAVGNPFYPLLNSVFKPDVIKFDSNLNIPPNEFATRKLFGESPVSIILIPFRMFFSGSDSDLIGGFDGVLNPMLLLMFIPLLFPKFRSKSKDRSIIAYLSIVFLITYIFFLIHGHLRIRYFIYSLPLLIILNAYTFDIFKNLLSAKKLRSGSIILSMIVILFMFFNLKYSLQLFNKLDTYNYLSGNESKDEYLSRTLSEYNVAKKINERAPEDAVIYEVLCGHRTYHIDRTVVFDDYFLDRYFYNMIDTEATDSVYLDHLSHLPFKDHKKAGLLMIKPHGFANVYKQIFSEQSDSLTQVKIDRFITFLNGQTLLFDSNGTFIYKLNNDN
ncbi:MAG: glycosyltransferase family 39 protein [Candidatus Delongbacteria bacterium]|nr:glycosyltransferase family 39 protein [Candidatus Delongbacteria bacterium]